MSQCVPSWDLDDSPPARLPLRSRSNSIAPDVPLLDYEVAELTWENGQIAMHGLGPPRVANKPLTSNNITSTTTTRTNSHACKYWEKPRAGGTLEAIVNQATRSSIFPHKTNSSAAADELVPWFDHHNTVATAATAANSIPANMDAQVPFSHRPHRKDVVSRRSSAVNIGSYTQAASGSGAATQEHENNQNAVAARQKKRASLARVPQTPERRGRPDPRVSGTSATFGSHQMRMDQYSCERDLGVGFSSTSLGSLENASSGEPSTKAATATATATATAADDHDSICHSRLQASERKNKTC